MEKEPRSFVGRGFCESEFLLSSPSREETRTDWTLYNQWIRRVFMEVQLQLDAA